LWAGIGEAQKLSLIFIGSFFQLVLMIAVTIGNTRRDLVEPAYTLGASDTGIVTRVLLPSAAPDIAELIGSSSGIGHTITDSQFDENHRRFFRIEGPTHRGNSHRSVKSWGLDNATDAS
jgi:ABC-type nitrate/sulfonate/bicarbonate transport system permease component